MSTSTTTSPEVCANGLRVAVEGCGHGNLNAMYEHIADVEANSNRKVDLLIVCGDFQAVRNALDLHTMSVPECYRRLGDFHEYYSGVRTAPVLTIFIGGNHEASSHCMELFYGGWVCPNIYYMGAANVIRVGGLRIAGVSGIYKRHDYRTPRSERLPYTKSMLRSAYHVRAYDIAKLLQVTGKVDIALSHDWPQGIEHYGDIVALLRKKPFFADDIKYGQLGSGPARNLLFRWRPRFWFSGHLHVHFSATVNHEEEDNKTAKEAAKMAAKVVALVTEISGTQDEGNFEVEAAAAPEFMKNEDEIDLEEDLQDLEAVAASASVKNEDEIDLDEDLAELEGAVAPAFGKNEDEVDLDEDLRELERPAAKREKFNLDEDVLELEAPPAKRVKPNLDEDLQELESSSEKRAKINSNEVSLDLDEVEVEETAEISGLGVSSVHSADKDKISPTLHDVNATTSSGVTPEPVPEDPVADASSSSHSTTSQQTQFFAGRKCLPARSCLRILEIPCFTNPPPPEDRLKLYYDPEWLAITRALNPYLAVDTSDINPIPPYGTQLRMIEEEKKWVEENVKNLKIPVAAEEGGWVETAPATTSGGATHWRQGGFPPEYNNPQTGWFCEMLGIENKIFSTEEEKKARDPTYGLVALAGTGLGGNGKDGKGGKGGRWRKRSRKNKGPLGREELAK